MRLTEDSSNFLSYCSAKEENEDAKKLKVTMVGWDYSDEWVITAVSDYSLKIWRSSTGTLEKVLTGHVNEIYVLESHPYDTHVVLSAGHDGQLIIWDIIKGEVIMKFTNNIEGQGYGAVFDVKWSPDGTMIAASDSHGHILIYGFGAGNPHYQKVRRDSAVVFAVFSVQNVISAAEGTVFSHGLQAVGARR